MRIPLHACAAVALLIVGSGPLVARAQLYSIPRGPTMPGVARPVVPGVPPLVSDDAFVEEIPEGEPVDGVALSSDVRSRTDYRPPRSALSRVGYYLFPCDRDGPDIGLGCPLRETSWMNRPNSVGGFIGVVSGDRLMDGRVDMEADLFGGIRLGHDFNYYWGGELRMAWGNIDTRYDDYPERPGSGDLFMGDVSLLVYPWGDSRWRPYYLVGFGATNLRFEDDQRVRRNSTLFHVPMGIGLKYQCTPWWVMRAEVLDNIAFGDDQIESMHNVTATLGVEFRFGGPRPSYWPWYPGDYVW